MGDINVNTEEPKSESAGSLKELRTVKPSENIAIVGQTPSARSVETESKKNQGTEEPATSKSDPDTKVETFFEKPLEPTHSEAKKLEEGGETKDELVQPPAGVRSQPSIEVTTHTAEELATDKPHAISLERKNRVASATSGLIHSERIVRNQSDIFSLKEQTSVASSIFSVNGSPSRKVVRRKEAPASNVFPFGQSDKEEPPPEKLVSPRAKETYNELTRPSGSLRNPLTGTGLSSNDEYKFKGAKRKGEDGNPLLGLGYSPEATPSSHRIPPGGFSHQLW